MASNCKVHAAWCPVGTSRKAVFSYEKDVSLGQRFFTDSPGVYMPTEANKRLVENYVRYAPVFGDGTYMVCWRECLVDSTWRMRIQHPSQKTQHP